MSMLPKAGRLSIAHRGARAYAPENTLAAFAKAKNLGCQMFELDVQLTSDGEVVVYHDEDLIRCTDAKVRFPGRSSYFLGDFTYKELSQLDAGSWYVQQLALPAGKRLTFLQSLSESEKTAYISPEQYQYYASGDIKIPTLTEALCLAKELDLMVNIELKAQPRGGQGLVETVLSTVKAMAMDEHILISSFEHEWLEHVRLLSKSIAMGVLATEPIAAPVSYLRKLKANAYNLGRYKDYDRHGFNGPSGAHYLEHIAEVLKAGFQVNVWTCNERNEMAALFAAGITGLFSDYPNRVSEQLSQLTITS